MERNVKKLIISGYYGFGNSGDEAVLHAILLALRGNAQVYGMDIDPIVLSIDPEATERMHGVKAVHRLRPLDIIRAMRESDGLISGGGSLLQDLTGLRTIPYYISVIKLAQWLNKPTFIYSQGLGPIKHSFYYPLIRNAFKRCRYISVRDEESVQLLRRIGLDVLPIDLASDPVMGLQVRDPFREDSFAEHRAAAGTKDEPLIGVSVRLWHPERRDLLQLTEALRKLLDARPVKLRFLPFHPPKDEEASRFIMAQLGEPYRDRISLCPGSDDPKVMLHEVSGCDLLIGMRLHSLIYAASHRIPMIGISYDPKIDHFLRRLEMEASGSTEHIDPELVVARALDLLDRREAWAQEKAGFIDELQKKSQLPAQQIFQYLRISK